MNEFTSSSSSPLLALLLRCASGPSLLAPSVVFVLVDVVPLPVVSDGLLFQFVPVHPFGLIRPQGGLGVALVLRRQRFVIVGVILIIRVVILIPIRVLSVVGGLSVLVGGFLSVDDEELRERPIFHKVVPILHRLVAHSLPVQRRVTLIPHNRHVVQPPLDHVQALHRDLVDLLHRLLPVLEDQNHVEGLRTREDTLECRDLDVIQAGHEGGPLDDVHKAVGRRAELHHRPIRVPLERQGIEHLLCLAPVLGFDRLFNEDFKLFVDPSPQFSLPLLLFDFVRISVPSCASLIEVVCLHSRLSEHLNVVRLLLPNHDGILQMEVQDDDGFLLGLLEEQVFDVRVDDVHRLLRTGRVETETVRVGLELSDQSLCAVNVGSDHQVGQSSHALGRQQRLLLNQIFPLQLQTLLLSHLLQEGLYVARHLFHMFLRPPEDQFLHEQALGLSRKVRQFVLRILPRQVRDLEVDSQRHLLCLVCHCDDVFDGRRMEGHNKGPHRHQQSVVMVVDLEPPPPGLPRDVPVRVGVVRTELLHLLLVPPS
mmetsp:Transcript_41899/g.82734  ORF Transcript_41899/g.82734 Transcript_41899/m.82734 type:complete len:538 (-) Transcript_41899:353-1966(-)